MRMILIKYENMISCPLLSSGGYQNKMDTLALPFGNKISVSIVSVSRKVTVLAMASRERQKYSTVCWPYLMSNPPFSQNRRALSSPRELEKKEEQRVRKKEHHLWKRRDSAQSGQKVTELPNEKEAVYGALDKWTAWETEFPLIAAVKALKILRKRGQWVRVIQVAKWMLSKGQGTTMGTYDTLLLAFDMDRRVDEAKSLWNMIVHAHTRSVSKRLFSRMIALCDHHNMPDQIIEVFGDMEELRVKPDEDTVRRVADAFGKLNQEEKRRMVIRRYGLKWKYIHFKGERVRVRTEAAWDEDNESEK